MISRATSFLAALILTATLSACSDTSTPTSPAPVSARRAGSGVDPAQIGGAGGGGGNVATAACGTLSTTVQTFNIIVYTTRIGIGFSGSATNCGTRREAFQVDVVDVSTNPSCIVSVPHFIAPKITDPGMVTFWNAASTLINCRNTTHTFDITLRDTKTNTVLATTTVSAFL